MNIAPSGKFITSLTVHISSFLFANIEGRLLIMAMNIGREKRTKEKNGRRISSWKTREKFRHFDSSK